MRCKVTEKCFWDGSIRNPGDVVEFTGTAKEMPRYFEKVKPEQKQQTAQSEG